MLPPIPPGLLPVTGQQAPAKPRPDVRPAVPVQPGAGHAGVGLERHPDERSPEEACRQRRQRRSVWATSSEEGEAGEADVDGLEEAPRKGLWVDIEI